MTEADLKRIQKLLGESFVASQEVEGILTIKPKDFRVDMMINPGDLALSDESFVGRILDPALNNLQGALDQERPHHLNRHQQMIAKFGMVR